MTIRRKHEVENRVIRDLGMSKREVADVSRAFFEAIMEYLVEGDDVHIDGFGRFKLVQCKPTQSETIFTIGDFGRQRKSKDKNRKFKLRVKRMFHVYFSKSEDFKRRLRDKYGASAERK